MHQTFYIDIDEEITSVVERLRHARASEIILVVPKRALLIQSIVNLRILKREADDARLQLMMVTQDKLGKILIEKAGIFVQQKMENISDEEINVNDEVQPIEEYKVKETEAQGGTSRLNTIGSSSYFDEVPVEKAIEAEKIKLKIEKPIVDNQVPEKENLTNKELVLVAEKRIEKKTLLRPSFDLKPASTVGNGLAAESIIPAARNLSQRDNGNQPTATLSTPNQNITPKSGYAPNPISNFNADFNSSSDFKSKSNLNPNSNPSLNSNNLSPDSSSKSTPNNFRSEPATVPSKVQDKRIEDFFYQPNAIDRQEKKISTKKPESYNLSGKVHRWFWMFGFVATFVVLGIAFYVFAPKADLVVSVKLDSASADSQITGKTAVTSVDTQNGFIPAKEVSTKQEVSESFDASGSELVSNQKAHGMITIYNEYDSNPQALVATTRFLTSDGKLFRLVKGVTVPGKSTVNGQVKNGEVEAEVTADSSGEEYNISPTTFNIPGLKSSGVKYDKIYAKSSVAMTGGGAGAGESKVVTDSDIATAKSKIISALNAKLEEDIKKSAGGDAVILDGAMNEADVLYNVSNSTGDVVNSFQVTASTEAKALAVSQADINQAVLAILKKTENGKNIDATSVKIDFSRSTADFTGGTLDIKFRASGKITPEFTADTIKKAVLGKSEEQIKSYLGELSNIEKVEVNYWPPFINGKIPFLSSRVNVSLDGM